MNKHIFICSLQNDPIKSSIIKEYLLKNLKSSENNKYFIESINYTTIMNRNDYSTIQSNFAFDVDSNDPVYLLDDSSIVILLQETKNLTSVEQNFLNSVNKGKVIALPYHSISHKLISFKKNNPLKELVKSIKEL